MYSKAARVAMDPQIDTIAKSEVERDQWKVRADQWKARAEAMERAILRSPNRPCWSCVYNAECNCNPLIRRRDCQADEYDQWRLDQVWFAQERFSKEAQGDGQ